MKIILKITIILLYLYSCDQPVEIVRHPPVIHAINLSRTIIYPKESIDIEADVTDEDQADKLSYLWQATSGHFVNQHSNPTQWYAPDQPDSCMISLTVNDGYFEVSKSTIIVVVRRNDSQRSKL